MINPTPFAREDVMQDYLDSLLTAPDEPDEVALNTARLLEQAALDVASELDVEVETQAQEEEATDVTVVEPAAVADTENGQADELQPVVVEPDQTTALRDRLDNRFQALFFEVAGLTLAVPLTTLGGIHQLEKVGPLIGKPNWFKGVMLHRSQKLNVVDTARWVMPEKCDEALLEGLHYQYLIMLGDSAWGLASEKLVNTITLNKDEIKWRESRGKRPWLAGMVKQRMCALIDVEQLISMLNNGLGSNDQMP